MQECWHQEPEQRCTLHSLRTMISDALDARAATRIAPTSHASMPALSASAPAKSSLEARAPTQSNLLEPRTATHSNLLDPRAPHMSMRATSQKHTPANLNGTAQAIERMSLSDVAMPFAKHKAPTGMVVFVFTDVQGSSKVFYCFAA